MTVEEASKKANGVSGLRLGALCVALFVLGVVADRAAGLVWRDRVTIATGTDPLLDFNVENEWEQFFAGGDPEAGERLFFDTRLPSRCGACHLFQGRGGGTGPNLSHQGKFPVRQVIRDIIDPMNMRPRGYEAITVMTTEGHVVSGIRQGTGDTLFVQLEDGEVVEIQREEVEDAFPHSVMPTNYAEQLTLKDFRDLLALFRAAVESEPAADAKAPSAGN